MTNKELIKFLRDNKENPAFGGGEFDYSEMWNKFARKYSDYGFKENPEAFKFSWHDYFDYLVHIASKSVLRPVSVTASAFVLVFGGWVATVNASFGSVPGDLLYPVKLTTERVQLVIASSSDQRARLHAEFASRRLDEVMDISSSNREGKEIRVREAVDAFKSEVTSVADELKNVSSAEDAAAVTELAQAVDRKVEEYSAVLGQNINDLGENQEKVDEATAAVAQVQIEVTETVVAEHETEPQPATTKYLDTNFQKDLAEIQNRVAVDLARLDRIQTALSEKEGGMSVEDKEVITSAKNQIKNINNQITKLISIFSAGGYRTVFAEVTNIKSLLNSAEETTVELEIRISTGN